MAYIERILLKRLDPEGRAEVQLRVVVNRQRKFKVRSRVRIAPRRWRAGEPVRLRLDTPEARELEAARTQLIELERALLDECCRPGPEVTRQRLEWAVERYYHPLGHGGGESVHAYVDRMLERRELSRVRTLQYRAMGRMLRRYEAYVGELRGDSAYMLRLDDVTADDLHGIERFIRNEHEIYDSHRWLYEPNPLDSHPARGSRRPEARGDNTVNSIMRKLRAYLNWCVAEGLTSNRPFDRYGPIKAERYGTPFYLTLAERDAIADFDLTARPALAAQRDIFVFQCMVGCRVADLLALTPGNVAGDTLEYVASKTRRDRGDTVRVPLTRRAREIIERYAGADPAGRLLPFISPQRYNDAIKEVLRVCGIDRVVTVLNPTTGADERRPIHEVASSHMARRTFVGNLYRRVKDPNLVGALSGHKEGSRAFVRYRDIDDGLRREVMGLIE